jgi:hypothetical protein
MFYFNRSTSATILPFFQTQETAYGMMLNVCYAFPPFTPGLPALPNAAFANETKLKRQKLNIGLRGRK